MEAVAAAGVRDGRWASASLWHLHRAAAASGVDPHCHTHGHWLLTANPSCLITASPGSERVAVPGALTRERSLGRPQPPAGAHHSGFSLASSSMRLLGPGEWGGGHMLGSFLISMAAQRDGPEVTQASDTLLPVSLMQELPYCPMPILARHSLVCCPLSLPKGAQHEQAEATAPCPRWPYSPVSAGLLPHKMPPPHPRSPVPLRVPLPTHTHMSHLVPGRGSSLSPATSIFGPSPV